MLLEDIYFFLKWAFMAFNGLWSMAVLFLGLIVKIWNHFGYLALTESIKVQICKNYGFPNLDLKILIDPWTIFKNYFFMEIHGKNSNHWYWCIHTSLKIIFTIQSRLFFVWTFLRFLLVEFQKGHTLHFQSWEILENQGFNLA